eukprot:CAMPEP_0197684058 /NCGR_PEP_ID=MMETSP1338-20131121/98908_1 /TAXON_ID=43686 ORGANISM="Pelagodinium beii, Strain RCC1491" /NCGR_SAMPLE_ID=MMETSP1338 /ASSEMBLY_ACC=CAM_ASM_000754 /LENGTH=181 /DNA_ID=CAMNT_0043265719 /DNA_START=452 /DNA_END=997 /DNA_ORIENTATION=-
MALACILIDNTIWPYYYFWRAFLIIKRKAAGEESIKLHGQVMAAGFGMTTTLLLQRPLQMLVIAIRWLILSLASVLPSFLQDVLEVIGYRILDHHIILSATTILWGVMFFIAVDGPRTKWVQTILGFPPGSAQEIFGSYQPSIPESAFWRCRYPIYIALRAIVTSCFTSDPNPMPQDLDGS